MSALQLGVIVSSFLASILFIPIVRKGCVRAGYVAKPRADRWHKTPTATLGGIAIFGAVCVGLIFGRNFGLQFLSGTGQFIQLSIIIGSILIFLVGLIDDIRELSPQTKLIGQIFAAGIVIFSGVRTEFFTPRISNEILAQIPNILLSFIWIVGITNSINLLDNMDGLAGGIALIATMILSIFFYRLGDDGLLVISLALTGSLIGFLIFNFPPAKIFMGDSGSLFIGFLLSVLAIARQPQASNVFAVVAVPTLIFLLPILDTVLVFITRVLRGQSPLQGGKDHSSHRLIAFGMNERKAILVLYSVALVSGILALFLESIQYWYSLVIVPLLVITLVLFTAYLGGLQIVESDNEATTKKILTRVMIDLTYHRRVFEVILDFFLISLSLYLALLITFDLNFTEMQISLFLKILPSALGSIILAYYAAGIYRSLWQFATLEDFIRFFIAAASGILLFSLVLYLTSLLGVLGPVFLIYFSLFLFISLVASRSSFRFMRLVFERQSNIPFIPIVIYGAGENGDLIIRWIRMNPGLKFRPVGFLDSDPMKKGKLLYGLKIFNTVHDLEKLPQGKKPVGLLISPGAIGKTEEIAALQELCSAQTIWVREFIIDLKEIPENVIP